MPGDWTKKFSPGEDWQPNARWLNNVTDATRAFLGSRQVSSGSGLAGRTNAGLILIQNNSGNDRKIGEVLGIDGALIGPDKNKSSFLFSPSLKGVEPQDPQHVGLFAISAAPIASTKVGLAYVFGVCAAQVNFISADDRAADITAGDPTQLKSGDYGAAQILANPSNSTGVQWALIRFESGSSQPFPFYYTKLSGGDDGADGDGATFVYDLYPLTDPMMMGTPTAMAVPFDGHAAGRGRLLKVQYEAAPDGSIAIAVNRNLGSASSDWVIVSLITELADNDDCDPTDDGSSESFFGAF